MKVKVLLGEDITQIKTSSFRLFLIGEDLLGFVNDCKTVSGYRTDHSGVTLQLRLNQNDRGRSYWKFNNSLLKDREYIQLVKKVIVDVTDTYRVNNNQQHRENLNNNNNNDDDNTDNENAYSTNDQLLLEMILLGIRGETIKYSSRKKKIKQKEEKILENEFRN